ncbi:ParB/Srx family N-terminal domain-containing protein [Nitrobacter sp. TKz-YC02]|uniref:ParB/Srx family N-terminal domain-containing protein n=1 Tax=Nitrobacter sp. TKz-YC02 TaxID=3398704 RepID=UPI003CE7B7C0
MPKKTKKTDASPVATEQLAPRELPYRIREEVWPISQIRPYERNAKLHPQEQIDKIRASYREFGEVQRLFVDADGELIAGHGRHQALLQENVSEVRVAIAVDWTEEQKRRFRLLDNQLNLATGYDEKALKLEIVELDSLGVDVSMLGFEPGRIAGLLHQAPAGLTDPDEVPAEPTSPASRRGDVWILGRHRITCGDSTNPADAERVLGGARPLLMVTDPPYGVKYDAAWRQQTGHSSKDAATGKVLNDAAAPRR